MNEVSLITDFSVQLFQSNSLVNTMSMVAPIDVDTDKQNIYPLVNLYLREIDANNPFICYFDIQIYQQRNSNPKEKDSKMLTDSNRIDNINETTSIANKFINTIREKHNTNNIEIASVTRLLCVYDYGKGSLDGVKFSIGLQMENITGAC